MTARLALAAVALLALAACEREERQTRPDPAGREPVAEVPVTTLSPGSTEPPPIPEAQGSSYVGNAYHLSEGKRLYQWFNCVGCHGNGGGGMGPPLMDEKWLYGAAVEQIAASIRDGRPNGMPSFRGKVPEDQIWQLAAYVRSLSGAAPKDAAPGRNDDLMARPSENRMPGAATQGSTP